MKKFLLHIAFWGAQIALVYALVISLHAGPKTDYFYNRFTQPKAKSMIIGSSRAAQGIIPSVIKNKVGLAVFNYSFTNHNSPYGECYLEAIKRKISGEKGGIFVLEVSPFVLSNYIQNMESDKEVFDECNTAPSNMLMVTMNPNFEYMLRNYSDDIQTLTGVKERPYDIWLHDDGWLEINIPFDTTYFRENTEEKVKNYSELIQKIRPSDQRQKAFKRSVSYLKEYGTVVLVKIPVSQEMRTIENQYYPKFSHAIEDIAEELEVDFLDYGHLDSELHFTDGNHLHRSSAKVFTEILGDDLSEVLKD